MRTRRQPTFEALESKRCLAVTAVVIAGGDLRVEGAAEGPVEIVAVGEGAYQVTENGVVVADLTGVTDDICIKLDDAADGAVNTVTLNLGDESVDAVYADLGDGDNSFQLSGGRAESFVYRGGEGDDAVTLESTIDGRAKLKLGDGDNTATIAGEIDGSLTIDGRGGDDAVTIAATAIIADNFFARLGGGSNSVTHQGTVAGNFIVVTANEDGTVAIAVTATVGGDTRLRLGEQLEGPGHGQCHAGGQFGVVASAARELGFFFRTPCRR